MFVFVCLWVSLLVCTAFNSFFFCFILSWYFIILLLLLFEFFFVSLLWFVTAHRLSAGRIGCLRERLITQEKSYETLRAHEKRGKRRRLQKYYLKKHHQRENKLTSATKFEHRFLFRILKLGGLCFFSSLVEMLNSDEQTKRNCDLFTLYLFFHHFLFRSVHFWANLVGVSEYPSHMYVWMCMHFNCKLPLRAHTQSKAIHLHPNVLCEK